MKLILKSLLLFLCLLFFSVSLSISEKGKKTDEDRIRDVHKIASFVEAFKVKKGYYPYEEAYLNPTKDMVPVPRGVNIYYGELPEQYQYPPPGMSGRIFPTIEFKKYMEMVLGPIDLPADDRPIKFEPPYIPSCYQYLFDGRAYYVSAILKKPNENTREIRPGYYKYQVSSVAVPSRKILKFTDIEHK